MKAAAIILFFLSAILFFGMIHYWLSYKKPGVYPPKQVMKSRAITLAGASGFLLFLGAMISYFT